MSVKSVKLLSGTSVPWIAFGSGTAFYEKDCTEETKMALKAGFRHLDTAQYYKNEEYVGKAIEWALSAEGLGLKRDDLFITTKLDKIPEGKNVKDTLLISLEKLKVDCVDLFLIHMPFQHLDREGSIEQVWREMVAVKKDNLAKSVGVSNFSKDQIERLIAVGLGTPEVNQIEYHLLIASKHEPLLKFSNDHGIITSSWGGLTPILPDRGEEELADFRPKLKAVLDKLAKARGDSVTENQILLKWLEKKNVLASTTSSKESRIKEYLSADAVADLTDDEEKSILDVCGDIHFSAFGAAFTYYM